MTLRVAARERYFCSEGFCAARVPGFYRRAPAVADRMLHKARCVMACRGRVSTGVSTSIVWIDAVKRRTKVTASAAS